MALKNYFFAFIGQPVNGSGKIQLRREQYFAANLRAAFYLLSADYKYSKLNIVQEDEIRLTPEQYEQFDDAYEPVKLILPSFYAPYLIFGHESALTSQERRDIDFFLHNQRLRIVGMKNDNVKLDTNDLNNIQAVCCTFVAAPLSDL